MDPSTLADLDLDARVRIPDHVVHRAFASETVVLNLETGQYHGIDLLGARMLVALETEGSVRAAGVVLAVAERRDPAELEAVLVRFCARLAERGLVQIDGA